MNLAFLKELSRQESLNGYPPLRGRELYGPSGYPFRICGMMDNQIVWTGNFRDEPERDVFLWSLAQGELPTDDYAKSLVFPSWDERLAYWPVLYDLAWSINDLSGSSGPPPFGNSSVTLGATFPAKALAIMGACEDNGGTSGNPFGSFSDSFSSSWTTNSAACNGIGGGGVGLGWAVLAGSGSGSIVYHLSSSSDGVATSGMYVTGFNKQFPNDTSGGGSSSSATASTAPLQQGELFVGYQGWVQNGGGSFSQDGSNGWTATGGLDFFNTASGTAINTAQGGGGNTIYFGSGALSYAPNGGGQSICATFIVSFRPDLLGHRVYLNQAWKRRSFW